ncbi:HTTM domain-containing protein [Aureibaculum luteum]|uniref:HTTM domain-containing protein n=1 Tax=Aureibaculum luteum TaxID=1548456 RepID=UPI000E4F9BDB|nr:HTTM domain-containing protein [Aureibaculum luteum]
MLGNTLSNKVNLEHKDDYLVFFRMAIALFVGIHFISIYQDLPYLFGEEALIPNKVTDIYVPNYDISLYRFLKITNLDPAFAWSILTFLFGMAVLFLLLGFLTQPSAILLLLLHLLLVKTNVFFNYGVDYFTSICLFFLCFLPSNVSMSIDSLIFKTLMKKVRNKLNFQRIRVYLQVFMVISYFFSGFDKLLGHNWRNGESIWKTLTLPYSNLDFNINLEWLVNYQWIMIGMGWSVIIVEMCYFLINIETLKKYWLIAIIAMHFGIALVLNLYFFSTIMIILNLTAYYNFEAAKHSPIKYPKLLTKALN